MAHIKINYDGLQQQSAAMRNCIQNYESLISRTQALVNDISAGWEGESSVAYVESMQNYLQQAQQMVAVLERFRSMSDSVTQSFSNTDSQSGQAISRSF